MRRLHLFPTLSEHREIKEKEVLELITDILGESHIRKHLLELGRILEPTRFFQLGDHGGFGIITCRSLIHESFCEHL